MKVIKFNFCLMQKKLTSLRNTIKHNLDSNFSKIHGIYRQDDLNLLKTNKEEQQKIIERENQTFKKWKTYLNQYYKEWEAEVYSRSMIIEPDEGEKYSDYTYYNKPSDLGYDILMRKDKSGKSEIVLDLKTIPFLKGINTTVLKTIRLNKDHTMISFVIDLENNEKYCGGIYDISSRKYIPEVFTNVSSIEFSNQNNEIYILKNNKLNRPYCIVKHVLGDNPKNDVQILKENDDSIYLETNPTKDHKFLIINELTKHDSSVKLLDLSSGDNLINLFERKAGVKYFIEHSDVIKF
jgi:protease II